MKKLVLYFFMFLLSCNGFSKDLFSENNLSKSLILSGQMRQSTFGQQGSQLAYGLGAEFFLSERLSVRGGVMFGQNYTKITPAPLTWYLLYLLSNSDGHSGSHGSPHFHSHSGGSGKGAGKGLFYIAASLIITDGFAYNIPINKHLYFTPYFSPWELVYSVPEDKEEDICAIGAGLKYAPNKHFMCDLGVEYDRTALLADSQEGYSFNMSLGYRFSNRHR